MVCKNLEVMNTFLNAYDLSKLKPKDIDYSYFLNQWIYLLGREEKAKEGKEEQEEISNINNLNKFFTCNEIEAVSPQWKTHGQMDLLLNFAKLLRKI